MFNNNSNLSDLEGTNTEIKTYLYSIKELISKIYYSNFLFNIL